MSIYTNLLRQFRCISRVQQELFFVKIDVRVKIDVHDDW
jgi:hypothetical protein